MTLAEILLVLTVVVGIYYVLRPVQRVLEKKLRRALGVREIPLNIVRAILPKEISPP